MAHRPSVTRQYPDARCQYPDGAGHGLVTRHPSQFPLAHRPSAARQYPDARCHSVSTPIAPAVRIASSESVPHGARAVSTPVFKLAPIGRHSGPARPTSKPAIAGSRTLQHQRTEGPSPDFPRVLGRGPPSSPPGPVPGQASSTAHPSPPGPIPTQARASATGGFEHWPTSGKAECGLRIDRANYALKVPRNCSFFV